MRLTSARRRVTPWKRGYNRLKSEFQPGSGLRDVKMPPVGPMAEGVRPFFNSLLKDLKFGSVEVRPNGNYSGPSSDRVEKPDDSATRNPSRSVSFIDWNRLKPVGKPRSVSTSTRNSPCGACRSNTTLAWRGSRIPTKFPYRSGTPPLSGPWPLARTLRVFKMPH